MKNGKLNILLGVTGSVATILTTKMYNKLSEIGNVKIIATEKALHFLNTSGFDNTNIHVFTEKDEWEWNKKGDQVLHIDLKNWAHVLVIAPISANTISKLAHGLCDNLLTSIVTAWGSYNIKPIFLAPSMNTNMYNNSVIQNNLTLLSHNYSKIHIIEPQSKELACGENGIGAMADINDIVDNIKKETIGSLFYPLDFKANCTMIHKVSPQKVEFYFDKNKDEERVDGISMHDGYFKDSKDGTVLNTMFGNICYHKGRSVNYGYSSDQYADRSNRICNFYIDQLEKTDKYFKIIISTDNPELNLFDLIKTTMSYQCLIIED